MAKSRKTWMQEHVSDEFVKRAQSDGWRSRASFKLIEIIQKYSLVSRGSVVVDLGAAPGGWSQVITRELGGDGVVVALDLLEMTPLPGVTFIQGDFQDSGVEEQLTGVLGGRLADLVISDMAPNISGVKVLDQSRWLNLAELALDFAVNHMKVGGHLVVKCFEGVGSDEFKSQVQQYFKRTQRFKPKASRDRSSEFFLVGLNKIK
ncbi:MAG: RlmE family RNA methyltransferase [Betaproteobacteria bacterium]